MPITKSAKKALRASFRKKAVNDQSKKLLKESTKAVERLVKEGKKDDAKKAAVKAQKTIDKAAKRGVIQKNTAARKKSRLSRITK